MRGSTICLSRGPLGGLNRVLWKPNSNQELTSVSLLQWLNDVVNFFSFLRSCRRGMGGVGCQRGSVTFAFYIFSSLPPFSTYTPSPHYPTGWMMHVTRMVSCKSEKDSVWGPAIFSMPHWVGFALSFTGDRGSYRQHNSSCSLRNLKMQGMTKMLY